MSNQLAVNIHTAEFPTISSCKRSSNAQILRFIFFMSLGVFCL